ncbi:RimK family alpha-L-glutamate ligase [Streptomyces sp. NPDC052396]|uniref:RimK family alpha-L-glutamate ligase n=1 Tax=Streptomyces sp. NPDC052396 TaxID=3365689 RepID=UPI0037D697D9
MLSSDRPLAVLLSRLRTEEKLLLAELERRHIRCAVLDTRSTVFRPDGPAAPYRGALAREVSHHRAHYAARLLEHSGVPVVNSAGTIALCGDKLLTTLALRAAGVPTPRILVGLTPQAVLSELPRFGLPVVVKPLVGSWGRLAARLTDADTAEAVLEHRAALPGAQQRITYVQEYVDKPGRDIRGLVAGQEILGAVYRSAGHWRTNTARDAVTSPCPVDDRLAGVLRDAAAALGPGVYGIDVVEDADGGLYVIEANHTPEFHGAAEVLGLKLVAGYVDYVLERLAK